ncbi:hypothetical protein SAMN05216387_1057 [Nitrosovibrio tenuis]|uniref:Uncharacterized protein n=1 Tax=Nitrosovibrio tenuis TaxID=1233 RepID=A0A1H7MBC8_9PROT|nr:hypothetical protein SAMN05216387_1057 [Nitrosovibrio tenuis]
MNEPVFNLEGTINRETMIVIALGLDSFFSLGLLQHAGNPRSGLSKPACSAPGFRIRVPHSGSVFGFRIRVPHSGSAFGFRAFILVCPTLHKAIVAPVGR